MSQLSISQEAISKKNKTFYSRKNVLATKITSALTTSAVELSIKEKERTAFHFITTYNS
jgi:hypothetical protein